VKEEDSCTEEIRFRKAANLGEAAYFTQEVGMIFELFAERPPQPREGAHCHPHCEVCPLSSTLELGPLKIVLLDAFLGSRAHLTGAGKPFDRLTAL